MTDKRFPVVLRGSGLLADAECWPQIVSLWTRCHVATALRITTWHDPHCTVNESRQCYCKLDMIRRTCRDCMFRWPASFNPWSYLSIIQQHPCLTNTATAQLKASLAPLLLQP